MIHLNQIHKGTFLFQSGSPSPLRLKSFRALFCLERYIFTSEMSDDIAFEDSIFNVLDKRRLSLMVESNHVYIRE